MAEATFPERITAQESPGTAGGFDPEGEGYDYASAEAAGLKPEVQADGLPHWPSRVPSGPNEGLILKGKRHPTFGLAVEEDERLEYRIEKGKGGRYWSRPTADRMEFETDDDKFVAQLQQAQAPAVTPRPPVAPIPMKPRTTAEYATAVFDLARRNNLSIPEAETELSRQDERAWQVQMGQRVLQATKEVSDEWDRMVAQPPPTPKSATEMALSVAPSPQYTVGAVGSDMQTGEPAPAKVPEIVRLRDLVRSLQLRPDLTDEERAAAISHVRQQYLRTAVGPYYDARQAWYENKALLQRRATAGPSDKFFTPEYTDLPAWSESTLSQKAEKLNRLFGGLSRSAVMGLTDPAMNLIWAGYKATVGTEGLGEYADDTWSEFIDDIYHTRPSGVENVIRGLAEFAGPAKGIGAALKGAKYAPYLLSAAEWGLADTGLELGRAAAQRLDHSDADYGYRGVLEAGKRIAQTTATGGLFGRINMTELPWLAKRSLEGGIFGGAAAAEGGGAEEIVSQAALPFVIGAPWWKNQRAAQHNMVDAMRRSVLYSFDPVRDAVTPAGPTAPTRASPVATAMIADHVRLYQQWEQNKPGPAREKLADRIIAKVAEINEYQPPQAGQEARGFEPPEMADFRAYAEKVDAEADQHHAEIDAGKYDDAGRRVVGEPVSTPERDALVREHVRLFRDWEQWGADDFKQQQIAGHIQEVRRRIAEIDGALLDERPFVPPEATDARARVAQLRQLWARPASESLEFPAPMPEGTTGPVPVGRPERPFVFAEDQYARETGRLDEAARQGDEEATARLEELSAQRDAAQQRYNDAFTRLAEEAENGNTTALEQLQTLVDRSNRLSYEHLLLDLDQGRYEMPAALEAQRPYGPRIVDLVERAMSGEAEAQGTLDKLIHPERQATEDQLKQRALRGDIQALEDLLKRQTSTQPEKTKEQPAVQLTIGPKGELVETPVQPKAPLPSEQPVPAKAPAESLPSAAPGRPTQVAQEPGLGAGEKQPWQMTQAEYVSRGWQKTNRAISFEEWANSKGLKQGTDYASDVQEADFIGNTAFPQPRTATEKGKQESLARLYQETQKLYAQYQSEVPEQGTRIAPNETQMRVLRKRHERVIQSAIAAGKPVPAEVLADYPDLQQEATRGTETQPAKVAPGTGVAEPAPVAGRTAEAAAQPAETPAPGSDAFEQVRRKIAQDGGYDPSEVSDADVRAELQNRGQVAGTPIPTGKESLQVTKTTLPPLKNVGDQHSIMGTKANVSKAARIDDVDYELYNANSLKDKRGFVRVSDPSTGEAVSLKSYPSYDQAEAAYNDAVRIAAGKASEPAPVPTPSTPQSQVTAAPQGEPDYVRMNLANELRASKVKRTTPLWFVEYPDHVEYRLANKGGAEDRALGNALSVALGRDVEKFRDGWKISKDEAVRLGLPVDKAMDGKPVGDSIVKYKDSYIKPGSKEKGGPRGEEVQGQKEGQVSPAARLDPAEMSDADFLRELRTNAVRADRTDTTEDMQADLQSRNAEIKEELVARGHEAKDIKAVEKGRRPPLTSEASKLMDDYQLREAGVKDAQDLLDLYEKAAGRKRGESLEEFVRRLFCEGGA